MPTSTTAQAEAQRKPSGKPWRALQQAYEVDMQPLEQALQTATRRWTRLYAQ